LSPYAIAGHKPGQTIAAVAPAARSRCGIGRPALDEDVPLRVLARPRVWGFSKRLVDSSFSKAAVSSTAWRRSLSASCLQQNGFAANLDLSLTLESVTLESARLQ
jgi:hypothetical protein